MLSVLAQDAFFLMKLLMNFTKEVKRRLKA